MEDAGGLSDGFRHDADALDELLTPPEIVILRGERKEVRDAQKELAKVYGPHRLVLAVPSDAKDLPPALAGKKPGTGLWLISARAASAPRRSAASASLPYNFD